MHEEQTPKGFLGIADAAKILGCSPGEVEELINNDKLKAIRSQDTLIPLPALHAYIAKASGEEQQKAMREAVIIKEGVSTLEEATIAFQDTYGQTPESWLELWNREEIEDTAENMSITIHATAIISEQYLIVYEQYM